LPSRAEIVTLLPKQLAVNWAFAFVRRPIWLGGKVVGSLDHEKNWGKTAQTAMAFVVDLPAADA